MILLSPSTIWEPGSVIPLDLSTNLGVWIYDPIGSQILGIGSRDPFLGSMDMSGGSVQSVLALNSPTVFIEVDIEFYCLVICHLVETRSRVDIRASYRVSQNYPNMHFSTIIGTALKPLKMWIPKFSEILIKRQS